MADQKKPSTHVEHIINVLAVIFLVTLTLFFLWHLKPQIILKPIFTIRHYEIVMISYVISKWAILANVLHLPVPSLKNLKDADDYMLNEPYKEVSFTLFKQANTAAGNWLRFPVIFLMLISALFLKFYHNDNRFQTTYNMQKLKKEDCQNWPQITPVLTIDLLKEDLDKGPWAMAKLPMDFCRENDLLLIGEEDGKKVWKIKSNAAQSLLSLQLGPTWTGIDFLPIEIKALIIIFVARALRERDISDKFLKQIASSAASGKLNFMGVAQQLEKYKDAEPLQWLERKHAYVYTFMASLLEFARSDGVLASAEFLWLKPVNRRLWYTLNTVGRTTAVVEAAGVYSHWIAEKLLGRGIKTPMVKEGVSALEISIEDSLFIEEGDRWRISNEE